MTHSAHDNKAFTSEEQQHNGHKETSNTVGNGIPLTPTSPPLPKAPPEPPSAADRGYAWVIVMAVFGVNTLCAGYIKSFGITYLLMMQHFPDASGAAAGWVMGLLTGARGILAPVMGAMSVKMGPRRCILAGTMLTVFGLNLAILLHSIPFMAFTVGCLVGLGIAMSETPGYLMIPEYFVEKRNVANGIRTAGNPMGGILFSPLVVYLNEQYGLQGTFIILAGIMLHLAVLGTLMRPFELQEQILHQEHFRKTMKSVESESEENKTAIAEKSPPTKALDFTLLKRPQFLLYICMGLFVNFALTNFLLYIPAYGQSVGLTNYQISIITSYQSGTDCVFRILCGCIVQKLKLDEATVFIIGLVVGGAGCLMVPLTSDLWIILLATSFFSVGMATFWTLLHTLLAKHFGAKSMASSWGFFRMSQGITSFIYPPLLGLIQDLTGSLVIPFLVMGSGFIVGGLIFSTKFIADCIRRKTDTTDISVCNPKI